jgi:hypothetical protein
MARLTARRPSAAAAGHEMKTGTPKNRPAVQARFYHQRRPQGLQSQAFSTDTRTPLPAAGR